MTSDQKKSLGKLFESKDWSKSNSNPNVVLDHNKNKVGTWTSDETFSWAGSSKTSGYSNTADKARKS